MIFLVALKSSLFLALEVYILKTNEKNSNLFAMSFKFILSLK